MTTRSVALGCGTASPISSRRAASAATRARCAGLGVWTTRYCPVQRIRAWGEAFVDRIDGRSVLIYIEQESNTPAAMFVAAISATRQGAGILLGDGSKIRAGVLLDSRGRSRQPERPQPMFTRWYGFALTFPGCEVFEQ
jgi:hypothetical protein